MKQVYLKIGYHYNPLRLLLFPAPCQQLWQSRFLRGMFKKGTLKICCSLSSAGDFFRWKNLMGHALCFGEKSAKIGTEESEDTAMPFTIIRNDITAVSADAIVNTANPCPVIGAGTDSAIHAKAGAELLEARRKIGDIAPGCSAETPAYGLDAKYVLHTVSPAWVDGQHREAELLRQAYDSALLLADELGCRSVAFPLMAAGSYRFPKDLALRTAIDAFTAFLTEHDMEIILVLFDLSAFRIAGTMFDGLKSYVDENYVSARNEKEYSFENISADFREECRFESRRGRTELPPAPAMPKMRPCAAAPRKNSASFRAVSDEILFPYAQTFSEKLRSYLMQHEGKDSAIYGDGAMSRQLFNKIINAKDYTPKKSTAIQLAIGLHLDLTQTQDLLQSAGYVLTHSDKRDVVVEYYIQKKIYKVVEIDIALEQYGLACLGKY